MKKDENKETEIIKNKDENKEKEEKKEPADEKKSEPDTAETTAVKSPADKKAALKEDKQYRQGKLIYDIGTLFMYLYMLLFAVRTLMHVEIVIGDTFVTSYLYFLFVVPLIMMVIGMSISDKAAKRLEVKENNKIWMGVIAAVGILVIALSVCEILMPSYKVYDLKTLTSENTNGIVRSGQEILTAEYRTGTILSPAPVKKPGYIFVDVYCKYGIFAARKQTASNNNGSYGIKQRDNSDNGYVLCVKSLGREESFPFDY